MSNILKGKDCTNCKHFYQMAEHDRDGDCKIELARSKASGDFVRPIFKIIRDNESCGPDRSWWESS